jgi:transposase
LKTTTDVWDKELLTQNEVAQYFRVSCNTIKNWRERGLLSFFRVPGSTRVLYLAEEIKEFSKNNLTLKKRGEKTKKQIALKKEMPVMFPDRKWEVA